MPTVEPAYPFNEFSLPSGGIILKTSDGVEFKVLKSILALSSSFFREMFTLPQPNEPSSDSDTDKPTPSPEVQVIDISETSDVVDKLLRFAYHIDLPSQPGESEAGAVTDTLEFYNAMTPVLEAAWKYDMQIVAKEISVKLLDAAEATTAPSGEVVDDTLALRIYAFACQRQSKYLARQAAHACLKGRINGVFVEELRQITAAQYYQLTNFHRKITNAICSFLDRDKTHGMEFLKCRDRDCCPLRSFPYTANWWVDFVTRANPILRESPKSEIVFSTDFLKESFRKSNGCGSSSSICRQAPGNWHVVAKKLKEVIDKAIAENDIDLSEI